LKLADAGGARQNGRMERDTMEDISRIRSGQQTDVDDAASDDPGVAPAPDGGEAMPDGQPVGADNIRDGTVRGVMGGPNQGQGQGQGG
jgi:hypothetical protein